MEKNEHTQPSSEPASAESHELPVPDGAKSEPTVPHTPYQRDKRRAHFSKKLGLFLSLVLVSVLAGALGSYIVIASGLVDTSKTITNNRDKIVLQQGEVVADVAKKVSPSVVSITTEGTSSNQTPYGNFGTAVQGAGSGIIVSSDGYIMTNKHVVPDGTSSVNVILSNGTTYKNVHIVGRDPVNDIAFLKVDGVNNLPAVTLGDSNSVSVGQQVVAIGNALGEYQNTVTSGIISGIGRPVQASSEDSSATENLENLFQTDAAINPGNSGGPLLDLSGEVIGMNTAVAQNAQGIGFAIPIDDAKGLIDAVIKTEKVQRGMLGVRYVAINAQVTQQYSLSVSQGAYLVGDANNPAIISGGAGEAAGLKEHDIITAVNGQNLSQGRSLAGMLGAFQPGDTVTLSVLRGNTQMTIKATLKSS